MFDLILMRHGKSDWHSHTADIDRSLNDRGREDAEAIGAYLKKINFSPDKMIVSAAKRTQETADLLRKNLPLDDDHIVIDQQLYLADMQTLCDNIALYASDNKRLLLLAHNPGMDYLVSYLASDPPQLTASGKLMTTCAAACFSFESLAALTKPGKCSLLKLIRPKEISVQV